MPDDTAQVGADQAPGPADGEGENFRVSLPRLVLGEGVDEERLLGVLLKKLGLSGRVQVGQYGGNTKLRTRLPIIARGGDFRTQIESLLILRDADLDAAGGFDSVKGALKASGLPVPRSMGRPHTGKFVGRNVKVSVLVFPGGGDTAGSLETLCCRSAVNAKAMACVEDYITCLQGKEVPLPENICKTRAYAYIATGKEAGFAVGRAAQNGYWDFDHAAWDQLKDMLLEM